MSIFDKFSKSPLPESPVEEAVITGNTFITISFSEAMGEIVNGKKITRVEWNNADEYFILKDGWLMVHHAGADIFNKLIVSEADLIANDWVVING